MSEVTLVSESETVLVRSLEPVKLLSAVTGALISAPETLVVSQQQGPRGPAVIQTKGLTIGLPEADESVTIVYTVEEITLRRLNALVQGDVGASITYTVKFGPDRNGSGTEVKTGGITVSGSSLGTVTDAFDHSVIPANSFVWFETTAKSGLVENFHLTMTY